MSKFPLIPIGQVAVVSVISNDLSIGGLQLTGGVREEEYVVATVIEVGTGNLSPMGQLIPNPVEVGDDIVCQKMVLHKFSHTVCKHIIERTPEPEREEARKSLENMGVVMCDHIVAKFSKALDTVRPFHQA